MMVALHKQTRWIGLLAALWLVAQLASAFHVGHADTESGALQDHGCLICKVAHADDVVIASAGMWITATVLVVLPLFFFSVYIPARLQTRRARAPPLY